MPSFFGLKFGADKKKKHVVEDKVLDKWQTPEQNGARRPSTSHKGSSHGGRRSIFRPSTSASNRRSQFRPDEVDDMPSLDGFKSTSTWDVSATGLPARKTGGGSSGERRLDPGSATLKPHASDAGLRTHWGNGSSTSLVSPPAFASRPGTPSSRQGNQPWGNIGATLERPKTAGGPSSAPRSPLGKFELELNLPKDEGSLFDVDLEKYNKAATASPPPLSPTSSIRTGFAMRSPTQARFPQQLSPTGMYPSSPRSIHSFDQVLKSPTLPPSSFDQQPSSRANRSAAVRLQEVRTTELPAAGSPAALSPTESSRRSSIVRSEAGEQEGDKPVIQTVWAKRETSKLVSPRRNSLSMTISEFEKALVEAQKEGARSAAVEGHKESAASGMNDMPGRWPVSPTLSQPPDSPRETPAVRLARSESNLRKGPPVRPQRPGSPSLLPPIRGPDPAKSAEAPLRKPSLRSPPLPSPPMRSTLLRAPRPDSPTLNGEETSSAMLDRFPGVLRPGPPGRKIDLPSAGDGTASHPGSPMIKSPTWPESSLLSPTFEVSSAKLAAGESGHVMPIRSAQRPSGPPRGAIRLRPGSGGGAGAGRAALSTALPSPKILAAPSPAPTAPLPRPPPSPALSSPNLGSSLFLLQQQQGPGYPARSPEPRQRDRSSSRETLRAHQNFSVPRPRARTNTNTIAEPQQQALQQEVEPQQHGALTLSVVLPPPTPESVSADWPLPSPTFPGGGTSMLPPPTTVVANGSAGASGTVPTPKKTRASRPPPLQIVSQTSHDKSTVNSSPEGLLRTTTASPQSATSHDASLTDRESLIIPELNDEESEEEEEQHHEQGQRPRTESVTVAAAAAARPPAVIGMARGLSIRQLPVGSGSGSGGSSGSNSDSSLDEEQDTMSSPTSPVLPRGRRPDHGLRSPTGIADEFGTGFI